MGVNQMSHNIRPGSLVQVDGVPHGVGKCLSLDDDVAEVEWFRSVGQYHRESCPTCRLHPAAIEPGIRCFVTCEGGRYWRIGRALDWCPIPGPDGEALLWVRLAGERKAERLPVDSIWIRCELTPGDPTPALAGGASETPFFHQRRAAVVESLIRQRAAAQGLTGLISSSIVLLKHQVAVARRVLHDPVQRYLLADEVGLGKTIEAGIILRQVMLDDPSARALILVPQPLLKQWHEELSGRFGLRPDSDRIELLASDQIPDSCRSRRYDILIVDEAHHIARAAHVPSQSEWWQTVKHLCHHTPRVLLLSATPALHHEHAFLAMLHLLEPLTYCLDDLEAFRRQVEMRQDIGRLLMRMAPGASAMTLYAAPQKLASLLPHDDWVQQKVGEVAQCLQAPEGRQSAEALLRELRLHVGETHRLYRRLIRTRREQLNQRVLAPRADDPEHPPVTPEQVVDDRLPAVFGLLENWREAALAAVWASPEGERASVEEKCASTFRAFAEASGTDLRCLRDRVLLRLKLGVTSPDMEDAVAATVLCAPRLEGEAELLSQLLEHLAEDDVREDQITMLGDVVRQVLRGDSTRCVVFVSDSSTAQQAYHSLRHEWPEGKVLLQTLEGNAGATVAGPARDLARANQPTALVCDRSGEEGINLQCADVVIMLDTPWDPDRVEQRLGRLDRIGNMDQIRVRVLVPVADDAMSYAEAWLILLRDGLGIFSHSIADLQFLTPQIIRDTSLAALRHGPEGIAAMAAEVAERTAQERLLQSEQAVLDSVETVDALMDDQYYQGICAEDHNAARLQRSVDEWLIEALRFEVLDLQGQRAWAGRALGTDPVEYVVGDNTDITDSAAERISRSQRKPGTWKRSRAVKHPQRLQLLRVGHPMLTELQDLLREDDRGRTFLMWRRTPAVGRNERRLFLRVEYLVEADLDPAITVMENPAYSSWALRALERTADRWLPPHRQVHWVTEDLALVDDNDLLSVLNQPYRKAPEGGDFHLDNTAFRVVEGLMPPDDWQLLCYELREKTEAALRSSAEFMAACAAATRCAHDDVTRRVDQLTRGLVYRGQLMHLERQTEQAMRALQEEQQVYDALVTGVGNPRVVLDAVGALILSGRAPDLPRRSDDG
jgi:ATP-dependent helicase HepA